MRRHVHRQGVWKSGLISGPSELVVTNSLSTEKNIEALYFRKSRKTFFFHRPLRHLQITERWQKIGCICSQFSGPRQLRVDQLLKVAISTVYSQKLHLSWFVQQTLARFFCLVIETIPMVKRHLEHRKGRRRKSSDLFLGPCLALKPLKCHQVRKAQNRAYNSSHELFILRQDFTAFVWM